jgi:polyisoprenoid-binding protein YceI
MLAAALLSALPIAALAEVQTYAIDDEHSFANWSIRHVVGRTTGTFTNIKGRVRLDTDTAANSSVEATIKMYSLESGHRERDIHVLTAEFLDANKFPDMKFVSTSVRATGKDAGLLIGNLTLHGVTREIQMPYRVLGFGDDPWGFARVGFEANTRINRGDFGINRYLDLPGGGPLGNEIDITLLLEGKLLNADGSPFNRKAEAKKPAQVVPAPATQPTPQPAQEKKKPDIEELLRGILK